VTIFTASYATGNPQSVAGTPDETVSLSVEDIKAAQAQKAIDDERVRALTDTGLLDAVDVLNLKMLRDRKNQIRQRGRASRRLVCFIAVLSLLAVIIALGLDAYNELFGRIISYFI